VTPICSSSTPTRPIRSDFFPQRYQSQLVAGYSKNTRAGGLTTFMPDYARAAREPNLDLTREFRQPRRPHRSPVASK
jgi:hypothetical protein